MGLPSASKRKPTASEVEEWALTIARIKRTINVDGKWGGQCWDLPNFILKKYWGFFTWGNANAMAKKSNYRGYNFKIYRNTKNFVPKHGDWAVWTAGQWGHVSIVVGKATKKYFWSVDQNWYTNNTTGSPPYKIKHTYTDGPGGGVTHFVRPPYHPEAKKANPIKNPKPQKDNQISNIKDNKPKFIWEEVKNISYTLGTEVTGFPEEILHSVIDGTTRVGKPKGIYIRNAQTMSSVIDLYRNRHIKNNEHPHYYIDRNHIWSPRKLDYDVPKKEGYIVVEICEDYSASKSEFVINEIYTLIKVVELAQYYNLAFDLKNIKLDKSIWRTMKEHINWDLMTSGAPSNVKYDELKNSLIKVYKERDKYFKNIPKEVVKKSKIKVVVDSNVSSNSNKDKKIQKPVVKSNPKVTIEKSKYTFKQALNLQMSRGLPVVNAGGGWFSASRARVSAAMDPNKIWSDSKQKYQMLNLGKYQGVSVDKLNQILKGKGKLHGQGKAFADACKKYNVNEIYLISHAFLESGYGTSNFASGRYGIYNFFGINAHDNNPNLAIGYAKNRGWTTPAKGIYGGAKFVRENYFNQGKNTLYRMRWNPRNPGTMQYATDINWCKHQASTIYNLYTKIGLIGAYFIRDQYKK
ncbi:glucosaminidase domain-containing protein [Staphylococcus xylosus]